jgi:hypothetical protein
MKRLVLALSVAAALAWAPAAANPVIATLVNEFQVAPDSHEWLELDTRGWSDPGLDLSGWTVRTRAGVATINSGVVIPDQYSKVIIDRTNTTGTFALADDSDDLHLVSPGGTYDLALTYPADPARYFCTWRPGPGQSVCRHTYTVGWPDPLLVVAYYFDATPTPGEPNDDSLGGIFGRVTNQLAQPLCSAVVRISNAQGGDYAVTDGAGNYSFAPTGPGTFRVSASRAGYADGQYPDSVETAPNESRQNIDITLASLNVAESRRRLSSGLEWRKATLTLALSAPAEIDLQAVNMLGRVGGCERSRLSAGVHRLSLLADQPSGVYLVQGRVGAEPVRRRIAIVR